jgi:hypothetical protein
LEDSENAALLRWLLGENGTVARILEERGAVTQLYYYVGGEREGRRAAGIMMED